jgi:ATP-binding cassette subfamily F protein 3
MEQRRIDREIAEKHYKNQQKEIARQEAYIAQQRAWNRERNIIAAESRLKMLAKMDRIERPKEAPKPIHLTFKQQFSSGNDVLAAKGLAVGYCGVPLVKDLSFLIKKGERVFVAGPNGCGKSTLIKTLIGAIPRLGRDAQMPAEPGRREIVAVSDEDARLVECAPGHFVAAEALVAS